MNSANDSDCPNTDSWMSDQFLSQIIEFNNEFKERSPNRDYIMTEELQNYNNPDIMPEYQIETPLFHTTATTVVPFESENENSLFEDSYGTENDLLDISVRPVEESQLSFEAVNDVTAGGYVLESLESPNPAIQFAPSVSGVAESVFIPTDLETENLQDISTEEELKILNFLEEQARNPSMSKDSVNSGFEFDYQAAGENTPIIVLPAASNDEIFLYCGSCEYLFSAASFTSHLCIGSASLAENFQPYIDFQKVASSTKEKENKTEKQQPLFSSDLPCIRLLKENQIRIRHFLKEELKYEVYPDYNNYTNVKTRQSSDTSLTSNSELATTSSSAAVSQQNPRSNKKEDGPHECTLCDKKFVHASGLFRHMEKHALDLIPVTNISNQQSNSFHNVDRLRVVIKCILCGRIFFEQYSAFVHLSSHFPEKVQTEQDIDISTDTSYEKFVDEALDFLKNERIVAPMENTGIIKKEENATKYLKMVILSCILQCEFCEFVFSDVTYLFIHSSCHLPERRFECFSCGICVKSSKEISNHWQAECVFMRESLKIHKAITQRYFVCNVCENKFQTLDLLLEHRYTSYHFFPRLNKRFGILQLPCDFCDHFFNTVHDCMVHYDEKHYKRYKRGEKEGTGGRARKTRQYLCDICGKTYTQSSHLFQHLRFHQGVKPFACKEDGCTRKFTIRPDLNDHIRKCHTGERPYHCLICGKRFLTGSVFYQHRLIHRGERRYECGECGKRFYRADALKNHQRIHTGEKPYGCLFCTKNFRQRGDRDKHIRARHSHLDANGQLMMQMHKFQLEAAEAFKKQQQALMINETLPFNNMTLDSFPNITSSSSINNENIFPSSSSVLTSGPSFAYPPNVTYSDDINNGDVIMIGNVPGTMIQTIASTVDDADVLNAIELNINVS